MKKMSVQGLTIQQCRDMMKTLETKNDAASVELKKALNKKIGELLQGAKDEDGKLPNSNLYIHQGTEKDGSIFTSVKAKNDVPTKDDVKTMGEYRNKDNVKDTFGENEETGKARTKAEVKQDKAEMKAAKKKVKQAEKDLRKYKFDINHKEEYNKVKAEKMQTLSDAKKDLAEKQNDYAQSKAEYSAVSGRANRGIRKAAKHNEKHYDDVSEKSEATVYLSKEEAKAAPKGQKTIVLNEGNLNTLASMHQYAKDQIEKAEQSGSSQKLATAKENYGEWLDIFGKTEDGKTDYSKVDTKAAQKALMHITGDDANGNLDEVQVAANMLGVSKGEVKNTLKAFGFGTESALNAKLKAGGITAAATALGSVLGKTHSHKEASASATAQGETVQGEVKWLASNGEEFRKYYEAKGGDAAVSVVAEACAKIPVIGKLAAPALAGVTAFLLTKGQTEDAFNGATVETALNDLKVIKGKDNQAIVNKIQQMSITGDKGLDDGIKAAVIKASIGENTTKANTEELLAAFNNLEKTKDAIGKIQEQQPVDPPTPPTPPEEPEKPNLGIEDEKHTEHIRTELPRMPLREGTWYTSHGYVSDDGKTPSEADRRKIQKELGKEDNRIAYVDTNGDGKANSRDKKVSLPTELEIDGKKYKLADNARARIMKLPARAGGRNGRYGTNVEYDRITHKYYVTNNGKRITGGFSTREAAEAKKAEFEKNPDTIPKDK